jgi:fused signal recognition particle receptor
MKELTKIRSTISKKLSDTPIQALLVVDSMLGQNSLEQAKIFNQATNLDGIVLTKLDGTGKGGILFAITNQLHLPIIYVTFGETVDALKDFDAQEYVKDLLG